MSHLTGKDYTNEISTFFQTEQRRPSVMTSARIEPFL